MSYYECDSSYADDKNIMHRRGEVISQSQYDSLLARYQIRYSKVRSAETYNYSSSTDDSLFNTNDIINTITSIDFGNSSNDSSSDFGGFGGGDTGGGGASGDW